MLLVPTSLGLRFQKQEDEDLFISHLKKIVGLLVGHPKLMISDGTATAQQPAAPVNPGASFEPGPFLYCLNRVTTKRDDSIKRGAEMKSLAICSRHHYIDIFKVR